MSKHTPGPWKCGMDETMGRYSIFERSKGRESEVAFCNWYLGSSAIGERIAEANARLIAAAPDLLEACLTILNTEGAARIGCESKAMEGLDWKYHYDKVRAATKKAGWTG